MTSQEIKNTPELVDFMLDKCVTADSRAKVRKRLEEVCDIAIKALEQEPCEDAISRQAVMEHYSTGEIAHCHHISRNNLLDFVEQLPPVALQPKIGHWIDRFPAKECKCSVCNFLICISNGSYIDMVGQMKYCPNCGAKMVESQESEDKE